MAMGITIGTCANDLSGRCSLCGLYFTNTRLPKILTSTQFSKFHNFCVPGSYSSSGFRFLAFNSPRSALGNHDTGAKDESSEGERSEGGSKPGPPVSASPSSDKRNPAQSALSRALAYKKAKAAAGTNQEVKVVKPSGPVRPKNTPEVEFVRGQSFQSRLQPTDARSASETSASPSFSISTPTPGTAGSIPSNTGEKASLSDAEAGLQVSSQGLNTPTLEVGNLETLGQASKSSLDQTKQGGEAPSEVQRQSAVSLDAFKKAQAYKQQQAEMMAALAEKPNELAASAGSSASSTSSPPGENLVEVEIVTRDGVIKKLVNPEKAFSNVKEFKRTGVSSIDFAGLGFADKKQGGRKVIREDYQAPPPGALPEVEILTKDAGNETTGDGEESDLYKPKVSTWGLFPRPADISKAYGGGRTIRPGDPLETEEERIAREAKTKKLLADYKKKLGLDVDPRVKAQCEKFYKQGISLMESGDLRGALLSFEEVMEKMVFQSELYGSAALQGAICLDSLARFSEAKEVYEKLLSHPSGKIRKQARQLLYGFRAMENLKVSAANKWDTTQYAKYFEAFADGYNNTYKAREDETSEKLMEQTLAYSLLLFFPVLLVVVLALAKNS